MTQHEPEPRRLLLTAAFLAVSVIWGSTYFGIRIALESYPPFFLGAVRFFVAGGVLFAVARARRERLPTLAEWGAAGVTGTLFFVIGNGLVNLAEQSVSSGVVSVLVATMPLWAALIARISGDRLSRGEVAGVLLGLIGVAVLNLGGELRARPGGAVAGLLAPMGWAFGSILSKRLRLPQGMMRTAAPMVAGGAAMFVVSAAIGEHRVAAQSARSVAAVVYLCFFGSLIGFSAFSYLLTHARLAVATSYTYVNPVIAVVLGVVLAGEPFGVVSFFGASIVLAAVVVVIVARSRPPRSAQGAQ